MRNAAPTAVASATASTGNSRRRSSGPVAGRPEPRTWPNVSALASRRPARLARTATHMHSPTSVLDDDRPPGLLTGGPVVIEARGLGKTFRVPEHQMDTLKE